MLKGCFKKCSSEIHDIYEKKILKLLDVTIHLLIFLLILALFVAIIYELYTIFFVQISTGEVRTILDSVLFTLILVELFTILYTYMKDHEVRVSRIIEVGIISIVREVIFKIFEIEVEMIYATSALLLVLGAIFFVERYFSNNVKNKN